MNKKYVVIVRDGEKVWLGSRPLTQDEAYERAGRIKEEHKTYLVYIDYFEEG